MSSYIMDNEAEGERIEQKTDSVLTREQLAWAGLTHGQRVLDLGCAAGTTSRIMADIVGPAGQVIGVDASGQRVEDARHRTASGNAEFRHGHADAVPLEDDAVDLAWSRFLYEYLPEPDKALREMIRVTKPGGTVVVSDLDGNCIWHDGMGSALQSEIAAAIDSFGPGFDPGVGRRLPAMFLASGLVDIDVDIRAYHIVCGRLTEPALIHWRMKLDGVRRSLADLGWPEERADALAKGFENHLLDDRTFTYSVLITVKGTKPTHQ
ncbi:MAG: methyltransferase domain-containing protein [Phycisphaerales bacterium]